MLPTHNNSLEVSKEYPHPLTSILHLHLYNLQPVTLDTLSLMSPVIGLQTCERRGLQPSMLSLVHVIRTNLAY